MKSPVSWFIRALSLLIPLSAAATVTPYFWTGQSSNPALSSANNWQDELTPDLANGTALLNFNFSGRGDVLVATSATIAGLHSDIGLYFRGASTQLSLGASGLSFNPSTPAARLYFDQTVGIDLYQDQAWSIATGTVELRGELSGAGNLTVNGGGTLQLASAFGSYEGRLTVNEGTLEIVQPSFTSVFNPVGSGTIELGSNSGSKGPTLRLRSENGGDGSQVTLSNDFILHGALAVVTETDTMISGGVTLAGNTTLATDGGQLEFSGAVTESTASELSVIGQGRVILTGANSYSGGTTVDDGVLIFGSIASVPAAGQLQMNSTGYIGLGGGATATGNAVSTFVSRFNPTLAVGTIGFDSDPTGNETIFDEAINLTGLHADVRLGSHTKATLGANATITPAGADYRFGGGGGVLTIASQLTGARGLVVDSPTVLPLTVQLTNAANNFTGGITLTHSGLILGQNGSGAFPALPAGSITMDAGSYFGLADPTATFNHLLAKFTTPVGETPAGTQGITASTVNTPGILGLDLDLSASAPRSVDLTGVDLSVLTQGYLGTSSRWVVDGEFRGPGLVLTGSIGAGADNAHRFAAYKGGALAVTGTLTGNQLIIGHPDSLGAFGDVVNEEYSTVLLSGGNSALTDGTTLYSGRLLVGQSNGDIGDTPTSALGSGVLTVEPVSFSLGGDEPNPLLEAAENNLIIANPIVVNARALSIGGENTIYLTGNISGQGELKIGEDSVAGFTAVLSGENTYSGGTYVAAGGRVITEGDHALGEGALTFGGYSWSFQPTAEFTSPTPVIHGLSAPSYGMINLTTGNQTLTIDQPLEAIADPVFRGAINSGGAPTYDPALLVKTGTGLLRLEGNPNDTGNNYGLYTRGLSVATPAGQRNVVIEIRQGTLAIADSFTIADHSSTIWVNGGTLGIASNLTIANPILASAGVVSGVGYASSITLGANSTLSPGALIEGSRIGALSVGHLTFAGDSAYEWDIASPDNFSARDYLSIFTPATLEITATDLHPFVIRPVTLDSSGYLGVLGGIDPGLSYSWEIVSYENVTGITQLLNPTNVTLDLGSWQATVPGTFDLQFTSLSGPGQLLLNFTPVPEPSTYALLALGLGFVVWQVRRRRA